MRRTRRVAVLVLFLIPVLAHAGEREWFDFEMKKGLSPAPAAHGAFSVEGDVLQGEARVGHFRFSVSAEPAEEGSEEPGTWLVEEVLAIGHGEEREFRSFHASLLHDLTLVSARAVFEAGGSRRVRAWRQYEKDYVIERTDGDSVTSDRVTLPHDTVPGVGALLLFVREWMPHARTYDVRFLVPDYDRLPDRQTTRKGRLLMKGRGPWGTEEAYLATIEAPEETWTFALDWSQRRLLGLTLTRQGREPFRLRPEPRTEKYPPLSPLATPPTSPETAFLCSMLGMVSGDVALVDASMHWDRMWQTEKEIAARDPAAGPVSESAEAARRGMLEGLARPRLVEHGRALFERTFEGFLPSMVTERVTDDEFLVWNPKLGGGGRARAVRVEGGWRLASVPMPEPEPTAQPAPVSNLLATPRGSMQRQLELIQQGDPASLRECFTERIRSRITDEMVSTAQAELKDSRLEDLWASAEVASERVEVKMPNGRALTSLILVEGRWLSNTIWFR